jgi:hypothetical protein
VAANLIYEVECELDPGVVADYDGWLPGHVRQVLAHTGFLGADVEAPRTESGAPARRRVRYRLESAAHLDDYLANHAEPLRAAVLERFGTRVRCERRVLAPNGGIAAGAALPARCLDCGAVVTGKHCAQCGQAADVHVLSMREVVGDVAHSLLHLDSRVWRTLRLLAFRPGELTREFIAGRHQRYLPPFRLYLAISILFFALSAVLPDSGGADGKGGTIFSAGAIDAPEELKKELEAEGMSRAEIEDATKRGGSCRMEISESPALDDFEAAFNRACEQIRADGGKRFSERFTATAPKLMFVFLPLIAAVALLFYWRPRRLYAEHLVVFLHNHAFVFVALTISGIGSAIGHAVPKAAGFADLFSFALFLYVAWYVFRSMRVVYGEGRFKTTLKFLAITTIYFVLLGVTMLSGFVYTMYQLA